MNINPMIKVENFWSGEMMNYLSSPWNIVTLIIDIIIVIFLLVKVVQILKGSRAMQLVKGILFLIVITWLSAIFNLRILNYILTTIMTYGVILLIVLFQPELRRALEQLGSSNKLTKYFGFDKDIISKTKEDIYKLVLAVVELSRNKTGALIVVERDIKLKEIISTGVTINSEITPQLLVNIFTPNTPLHDGAVVISDNKISAAACMLPLASDGDIARELGTRHRAAIGMSKESDAIVVVVSEETGKISIAKEGTLIADLKEEALKKILISNIITKRFKESEKQSILDRVKNIKFKKAEKKKKKKSSKEKMMRNIKLTIEYDGKDFNGWQKQPTKLNIQGEIERAITDITGEKVDLIASGRTDAGVHSLGQIANFKTNSKIPVEKIPIALNTKLKRSIRILEAQEVEERFHSRYNCKKKTYRYVINNSKNGSAIYRNLQYNFSEKLDENKMNEAIQYFVGEHDFKGFKASGTSSKSSVRTVYSGKVERRKDIVTIEITGNGFLYNMVRIIAGTLVEVGLGKIKPEEIEKIIESKDRTKAGKTLPPQGLYLVNVEYD